MVELTSSLERFNPLFDHLKQARSAADGHLKKLQAELDSDSLLSADLIHELFTVLNTNLNLQDECLAHLPGAANAPATLTAWNQLKEEWERTLSLAAQAEQAQAAIRQFLLLRCINDELEVEFKEHQAHAEQLLLQPRSEEDWFEAAKAYAIVVHRVRHPEEPVEPEQFRQITKSIGFVTRHALEQGWLHMGGEAAELGISSLSGLQAEAQSACAMDVVELELVPAAESPQVPSVTEESIEAVSPPVPQDETHAAADVPSTNREPLDVTAAQSEFAIDFSKWELRSIDKGKGKGSFSANKFEGDLKQVSAGATMLSASLMVFLYNYGLAASGSLETMFQTAPSSDGAAQSSELLQTILQKLCQKGYLTEYQLEGEGSTETGYSLSEYGSAAFRKETSRKFIQSRSRFRLVARPAEDETVGRYSIDSVYRLLLLDRTHRKLKQELGLTVTTAYTSNSPIPSRVLHGKRTDKPFLLLPAVLDHAQPEKDWDLMLKTLRVHAACIPILIAPSAEAGTHWVRQLSVAGHQAYYLYNNEQTLHVRDADGADCASDLFQLKVDDEGVEPETVELETVEPETVEPETVELEIADPEGQAVEVSVPGSQISDLEATAMETESVADIGKVNPEPEALQTPAVPVSIAAPAVTGLQPVEARLYITPDDLKGVVMAALELLTQEREAEAMLLLHSIADHDDEVQALRNKLAFVLKDPLYTVEDCHTLADTPVTLPFYDTEALDDCLNAAVWLRIFFEPDNPNDFRLNNRWRQINSDLSSHVLEDYPGIKQLIRFFYTTIERYHVGVKYCASTDVRDQLNLKQSLEQCRQLIQETLTAVFPRNIEAKINHPKIKQLVVELYGNTGVMTRMLEDAFTLPLHQLRDICQTFTDRNLSESIDSAVLEVADSKLELFLDRHWEDMDFRSSADKSTTLTGVLRNRMRSRLREAAEPLLSTYLCRKQAEQSQTTTDMPPDMVEKIRRQALQLMDDALAQLASETRATDEAGRHCLQALIRQLRSALHESPNEQPRVFYEAFIRSSDIELNKDYLPMLDVSWQTEPFVTGYRLWERVLRHCAHELPSWEEAAVRALRHYDMGMYDRIIQYASDAVGAPGLEDAIVKETRKQAGLQLSKYKEEFMTAVEIAQNYGQMASNDEMYGYFRLVEAAAKHAKETQNIGFFKRLLDACREQIILGSSARMEATRSRLEALRSEILHDPSRDHLESDEEVLRQWSILDKIHRMLDKRNMTVAEDYIQLAGSGQKDTPSIQMSDKDLYAHFMERYQPLYNACNAHKRDDLYRTYEQSVRSLLFPNQNNRNTASADKFIRLWFKLQPHSLGEFMEQLIFHKVDKVVKRPGKNNEYSVYPAARDAKLGQYPHPFEAFGTRAVQNGIRVLTMAGVRTADNVLDEVTQQGAGDGSATIVILDYALSLAERHKLAKSIKLRSIPEIIVVIDRVMALFLAGYSQIERGNAFLMVTLPSSKVQPYIPVGGIPPEMFIGRTDELDKIQNLNGPVFVYGGRQLGKTALLRESKNREHDPANGRYALFIDLKERDSEAALRQISEVLMTERLLQQPATSWDELSSALRSRLASQDRPIRKLMLLLDEADAFIASCERQHYRPLEILKELKDSFHHQFKFVLAGLRDVVRFNKQRLSGNSVLAHLGHITIRPLKYLDARDLLLRPLQYLGFRIGENGEDIISLILAKTNYYPGLIHFYCQKLIEAIADSYRNGNYTESSAPPYVLDEKHIKTLLGQSEFLSEIERKFRITLQLDADNLYDILARAMAYHYYVTGIGQGASVHDIMQICKEFEIGKISKLSEENVKALLEEMDELNIFRQETRDTGKYVFNRYSFFQMLGNKDQLIDQLIDYSGG